MCREQPERCRDAARSAPNPGRVSSTSRGGCTMPSEIVDAMEQRGIFPRRLILRLIPSVRMLRLYEWGFGVDSTLRRSWSVGRPARHTHTHTLSGYSLSPPLLLRMRARWDSLVIFSSALGIGSEASRGTKPGPKTLKTQIFFLGRVPPSVARGRVSDLTCSDAENTGPKCRVIVECPGC